MSTTPHSSPTDSIGGLATSESPTAFPFLTTSPGTPGDIGRLAHYRVVKVLGQGGMGIVFEAIPEPLNRPAALKVMRPEVAVKPEARERFLREARKMAAIAQVTEHPHVVPVRHVGEANGIPYLEMPLLPGESLATRLRREGSLPVDEVRRIGREVAEGLAAAHAAGIVHRDVKPDNIWLRSPNATAMVLDFGLARAEDASDAVSRDGAVVGTPQYMAPEQAAGTAVDARADLFSLGCVLYHLSTGRRPFDGPSVISVLTNIATVTPPSPASVAKVPGDLSRLIERLLAKEPANRPGSAREVAVELVGWGNVQEMTRTMDVAATPSKVGPPLWPWVWVIAPVVALLFVGLVLGVAYWPRSAEKPTPTVADTMPEPTKPTATPILPLKGDIDIVLIRKVGTRMTEMRLGDTDTLPLKLGDQFAVELELSRPAFAYVLWIDTDGKVQPLYPWKPGHFEDRPAKEEPITRLRRPEMIDKMFEVESGAPGIETLVLLARETPLPRDVDVQALLGELPQQSERDLRIAAWYENGLRVNDRRPNRARFDEKQSSDPVLQAQARVAALVKGESRPFEYSRSVSFGNRGG